MPGYKKEDFFDNLEEFEGLAEFTVVVSVGRPPTAVSIPKTDLHVRDDETIGYCHIANEFENYDPHKSIPRDFLKQVRIPCFQVQRSPFCSNSTTRQSSLVQKFRKAAAPSDPSDSSTEQFSTSSQADRIKQKHQRKQADEDGKEGGAREGNNESGIIQQIAEQIPELLDKTMMREILLSDSLIDGLRNHTRQGIHLDLLRNQEQNRSTQNDNNAKQLPLNQYNHLQSQSQSSIPLNHHHPHIDEKLDKHHHKGDARHIQNSTPLGHHEHPRHKTRDINITPNSADIGLIQHQQQPMSFAKQPPSSQLQHQLKSDRRHNLLRLLTDEEAIKEIISRKVRVKKVQLREDEKVIFTLIKDEFAFHYQDISGAEISSLVEQRVVIASNEECRVQLAHKEGGKECRDKKIKECLRNIGKDVIKEIGRKLISGNFNLTQVSFPIRAMIPKTILEKALYSTCLFPLYLNKAAATNDHVERFKLLICATVGNFYINCGFLKPMNPILGETCEAAYNDGTMLYAEQISHHPPISYITAFGPKKSYAMWGNYNQEVNAGLNSLKIKNRGSRAVRFASDGQLITYNFAKEKYSGSFMGTMKVESKGLITFSDAANNITAELLIGGVKKKPSDYLAGTIKQNNVIVSLIYGTYMGFLEFDGQRYWDFKHVLPFEPVILSSVLRSDQGYRMDKQLLLEGDIPGAQKQKEALEDLQRDDAKLRKKQSEAKIKASKKK